MNGQEQKARWNLKYEQGLPSPDRASPLFLSLAYGHFAEPSFPNAGVALDLACGLGRHALWPASRNWRVCGIDLSEVAIKELNHAALKLNVSLDLLVGDASEYKFGSGRVDCPILSCGSQSVSQGDFRVESGRPADL